MPSTHPLFGPLVRKLSRRATVQPLAIQAIAALPINVREFKAGSDIIREGDKPTQCCILVSGFLCRSKIIAKGKRQIISFHLAGDIPDLQHLHLATADHDVTTLTAVKLCFIPHSVMSDLIFNHPALGAFFWREALVEAAIFREWIANIGQREGVARIAHLICEQAVRLKVAGLGDETGFPLFFTQTDIGDAIGLSNVHTNRMLRIMREKKLISTTGGRLNILDWPRLVQVADFHDGYLHLEPPRPTAEIMS